MMAVPILIIYSLPLVNMPLIALTDLREMGEKDDRYTALADIVDAHKGLWCPEAEEYLLAHFEQE